MGVVFLAERDRHRAALKVIRSGLAEDPAVRTHFRGEVALARQVGYWRMCSTGTPTRMRLGSRAGTYLDRLCGSTSSARGR